MKWDEVLELIHRNGSGQDIKCSFISRDRENDKEDISPVYNYKYNKGILNIYIDELNFKKHKKNLERDDHCELFINQSKKDEQPLTVVKLFSKSTGIKDDHILARVFKIRYVDDSGKEVTQKISVMVNEKKVELF